MISRHREQSRRLEALRCTVPLVAACTDRQLRRIDNLGAPVRVPHGDRLTREGDRGCEVFFVLEGVATAYRCGTRVGDVAVGSVVGEMALLTDGRRTATVLASSAMELLVLNLREFDELLAVDPAIETTLRLIAAERQATIHALAATSHVVPLRS